MSLRFQTNAVLVSIFLAIVWLGFIVGVSFVATPAKFLEPELPLVLAVKVGRVTFYVSHLFQGFMFSALVILSALAYAYSCVRWFLIAMALILSVQVFGVYPAVQLQSESLFEGVQVNSPLTHHLYIVLELVKMFALSAFIFFQSRALGFGRISDAFQHRT